MKIVMLSEVPLLIGTADRAAAARRRRRERFWRRWLGWRRVRYVRLGAREVDVKFSNE